MRVSSAKFKALLRLPQFMRTALLVILCLLLTGCIVLGVTRCGKGGKSSGGGTALTGAAPSAEYKLMKESVIGFDGSFARAYSVKNGDLLWECSPDGGQGFKCAVSQNLVVLYKAASLSVYDSQGKIAFTIAPEKSISEVRAGLTRIAVCYTDDTIEIFDSTGKSVETLSQTGGMVMDYAFYSTSDLLWVLSLDNTGIRPKSTVSIHQPGKMLIASFETTDQCYFQPVISGSSVFLIGGDTIDFRNTDNTSENSALVKGWSHLDTYLGEQVGLLFGLTEQGDTPQTLRVYTGDVPHDVHMHIGCTDLMLGDKYVYGFSGTLVYAAPINGGKTISSSLPCTVTDVLCRISGSRALVTDGQTVLLVNLPG